jgi:UDP-N-acetyl-D-mannosaminuronate dehydrogenase
LSSRVGGVRKSKIEQPRLVRSYKGCVPAERIAELVESRLLRPTADFSAPRNCGAAIICIFTPLDEGRPAELIFAVNTAGRSRSTSSRELVVLENITYHSITYELLLPLFDCPDSK